MADPASALGFDERELDEYVLAARDGGSPAGSPWPVAVGALVLGVLIVVGVSTGRRDARAEDARVEELVELVREQKADVDSLTESLEELSAEVARRQGELASVAPVLEAQLAAAEVQAGLAPLAGPGVVVTLFDAPTGCTGAEFLCRVQDFDLQHTVNTLFSAGAEAVAIGDQRLVATTAVRAAGGQITVNYRYLDSPYEVSAVGDPQALEAALEEQDLAGAFAGAGSDLRVEVRTAEQIVLPAMTSLPDVRVARPQVATPVPTPTPADAPVDVEVGR